MSVIEELLPNVVQSFKFDDESLPSLEPYEFELNERLSRPYSLRLSLVAKDPSVDESKCALRSIVITCSKRS